MESIVNSVRSLFANYGFRAASIVIATVIVVNFIKKPIVRKAVSISERFGTDKAVITKYITALPVAVAFVIELVVSLVIAGFDFTAVDYATVLSRAVLYGALAVATYESVKKQMEAYAAKKNFGTGIRELSCGETEKPLARDAENAADNKDKNTDADDIAFSAND